MSHLTNALWIALSALLTEPLQAAIDERRAQEDAQEGTELEEVVVTATGISSKGTDVSPSVSRVERVELDRQGINTLQDISALEPALDISRHPRFGLDKITIRGLTDRRITTEVDGIPQQGRFQLGPVFTSSRDLFDFCTLAELNVTRGPNSSRPDRSALGSVISLRLLEPADLLAPGQTLGGRSRLDFSSDDNSVGECLSVAGSIRRNTLWLLSGSRRDAHTLDNKGTDDVMGGDRTVPEPQTSGRTGTLGKVQHFWGAHQIELAAETLDKKTDTWLLGRNNRVWPENRARDGQRRRRYALTYHWDSPGDSVLKHVLFRLYQQRSDSGMHEISTFAANGSRWGRNYQYGYRALGARLVLDSEIDSAIHQSWSYGVDLSRASSSGMHNDTECPSGCTATRVDFAKVSVPRTHIQQYGVFVQDKLTFPGQRFILSPSLRYDRYRLAPDIGRDSIQPYIGMRADRLSPLLGATYHLRPELTVFAQYGQGFRAPAFDELNSNVSRSFYATVGNRHLKPETAQAFELGLRAGDVTLGGSINLFKSYYRNFIERSPLDCSISPDCAPGKMLTFQYGNLSRVTIYGVETQGHWALTPQWKLTSSLVLARGKDTDTHLPLASVAPLRVVNGLHYRRDRWGLELRATSSARKSRVPDDRFSLKTPGYGKFDLIGWALPAGQVRVNAGIYNLTDQKYALSMDVPLAERGVPGWTAQTAFDRNTAPGRHIKVGVNYTF